MKNSKMVCTAALLAAFGCATTPEAPQTAEKPTLPPIPKVDSPSLTSSKVPFKLGVARYTLHRQPFERALEMLARMDCHYMGLMEGTIDYNATPAEIAAYKAKAASYGVEVVSAGPLYYSTEEEVAALFKFAKNYGMKYVSVVPFEWNPKIAHCKTNEERAKILPNGREWRLESDKMMDVLEKYVKMYDIKAAVHNHGPDNAYLYPTGEASIKRIGNRDKRIGVCFDVGHERRAGLDPVAFIKANSDRLVEIHMKNIKIDPVKLLAKEAPRGELQIPAIMRALVSVGFDGYCLVEYEKDFAAVEMPLAESFGYYRGVMDSIRVKPKMWPVPAGANSLTAAEKAEGYQLLFDGKNLPSDLWVGEKGDCKAFPQGGWYAEDGTLYMKPVNGITEDGNWFPLPPEDARLGGGGSIVTIKKYRDFCFKFDFRLTWAANSGIKYYYDETVNNKGTCEEYQVLDPGHPDYDKPNASGVEGTHRVAALYDLKAAPLAEKVIKPTGQWNSGMIVAKGNHVEHWLNGVKVVEYERCSPEFRKLVDASKYAKWGKDAQGNPQRWGEVPTGRIHIQDHSDSCVYYCNLKIKEL